MRIGRRREVEAQVACRHHELATCRQVVEQGERPSPTRWQERQRHNVVMWHGVAFV